jgi:hypothetical protein
MIENKTLDNAIKAYGEDFNCSYDYVAKAVQEKVDREKGCDQCNYPAHDYGLYEIKEEKSGTVISFIEEDGDRVEINLDYCNKCGRKLKKG